MSPPLQGDAITEASIRQLVDQVRQACSCSKPLATMGVDLPMAWYPEVDANVVLMDEELQLSELAAEVQKMLDAKNESRSETLENVAIPPGNHSSQDHSGQAGPISNVNNWTLGMSPWKLSIGVFAALSVAGMVFWIRT